MATNSVLRLFLIVSIMTIMAGIVLIVLNQFDRGYVFIGEDSDFQTQQKNLIDHVYQSQVETQETAVAPAKASLQESNLVTQRETAPAPVKTNTVESKVPPTPPLQRQPPSQQAKISSAQDIFAGNPWEPQYQPAHDYQTQLLRNNPWSPYYKPGH